MSKTIWLISKYNYPPDENSFGNRGWNLMKNFALKGFKSVVITSDATHDKNIPKFNDRYKNYYQDNINVIVIKTLRYVNPKSIKRALSWISFELNLFFLNKKVLPKPDVIIVSSLSLLTIINGIYLKYKFKCKLVFEIRDIWPLSIVENSGLSWNNPFVIFLNLIEHWGYKKSDILVGTMPNLQEHVNKVLGYYKPTYCIPMGVNDEMLVGQKKVSLEYLTKYLNSNYFNIVYAGSIGFNNSLNTFFEAAVLLKNNAKIKFVVVANGSEKNNYQKQYKHLPNLIFAPKVHKKQVQSVLKHADVLYFSTRNQKRWQYGQSLNKLIDYMFSNKPILASYSGYPSMINEANCGYFITPEDPKLLAKEIKRLYFMTKYELNKIGKKGRDWLLRNRTYKKLADDYLKILFTSK